MLSSSWFVSPNNNFNLTLSDLVFLTIKIVCLTPSDLFVKNFVFYRTS